MLGAGLLCLSSCGGQTQTEQTPAVDKSSAKNQVIETIMTRRSVRKYLTQSVNRDTMQMKRLNIPEGYELLYCIAFGYPDESPAAKPRDASKVMFVE